MICPQLENVGVSLLQPVSAGQTSQRPQLYQVLHKRSHFYQTVDNPIKTRQQEIKSVKCESTVKKRQFQQTCVSHRRLCVSVKCSNNRRHQQQQHQQQPGDGLQDSG